MRLMGRSIPLDAAAMLSPVSSVHHWLGHELEIRGIDAVVYTRYILRLLQHDSPEGPSETTEARFFPPVHRDSVASHLSPGGAGRGGRKAAERRRSAVMFTADDLKKMAAVECLLSVSDEESGIESLVDELCYKLKQQATTVSDAFKKSSFDGDQSSGDVTVSSQGDPAERYYAAFPALSDRCEKLIPELFRSECSLWAKVAKMTPCCDVERQPGDGSEVTSRHMTDDEKSGTDARRVTFYPEGRSGKGKDVEAISGRSLFGGGDLHQRQSHVGGVGMPYREATAFMVPRMKSSVRFARSQDSSCWYGDRKVGSVNYVLVDGVINDHTSRTREDQSWYTEPWDVMIPLSPIPRLRLYNRSITPQCEHIDDSQVLAGPRPDAEYLAPEKTCPYNIIPPAAGSFEDSLLPEEAADHRRLCASIADCEAALEAAFGRLYVDVDGSDIATLNSAQDGVNGVDAKAKGADQYNSVIGSVFSVSADDVNKVGLDETGFFESEPPCNIKSFCDLLGEMNESLSSTACPDDPFSSWLQAVAESSSSGCNVNSELAAFPSTPAMWRTSSEYVDDARCRNCCSDRSDYTFPSLLSRTVGHHIPTKNESIPFSTENEVLDHRPEALSAIGICSSVVAPVAQVEATSAPSLSEQSRVTSYSFSSDNLLLTHQLLPSEERLSVWSTSGDDSLAPFPDLTIDCSGSFDGMLTWGKGNDEFLSPSQSGKLGIWSMFASADVLGLRSEEPAWGCFTDDYGSVAWHDPWDLRGFSAWCSSPRHEAMVPLSASRISQIWDVNASLRKLDEDARWYGRGAFAEEPRLMNVCFELPDPDAGAFIEGGLYGNTGGTFCGSSTWSTAIEPTSELTAVNDSGVCTDFSFEPLFSCRHSADINALQTAKFMGSTEILLSENSAFQDRIPARLPHVQSAPCLSPQKLLRQRMIDRHLVQIRHLYKSDTSILRQLGLTPDGQAETLQDGVTFSPEKHFKPIHGLTDVPKAVKQPVVCDIFDGKFPSNACDSPVCQWQSCLGGYQPFVGDATEDATIADSNFVPRFRLNNDFEKYSQTGDSPNAERRDVAQSVTFHLPADMEDLIEDTDGDATAARCHESSNCDTSDYESMLQDVSLDDCAGLWASDAVHPVDTAHQSIWSCGGDDEIPSIPHCYSPLADVADPCDVFWDLSLMPELQASSETLAAGDSDEAEPEWMNSDEDDDDVFTVFRLELDEQVPLSPETQPDTRVAPPIPPPPLPHDGHVLYSAQLEEEWLKTGEVFKVQVPLKRPTTKINGGQRKPCSFFLEGNCRRTDCKYSHGLSIITCRFWEEGQCFKGITCPFLHGYYSGHPKKPCLAAEGKLRSISVDRHDFPNVSKTQERKSPSRGSPHGSISRHVRMSSERSWSTHTNTYQRRRFLTMAKTKSLPA